MSLPAKGSRRIELDGASYRWRVRRRPTADQRTGKTPLVLAVAREDGLGASLLVQLCQTHPSNQVRLRSEAVTPGVVAGWIRLAIDRGWAPQQPGKPYLLQGHTCTPGVEGPRTVPRGLEALTLDELQRLVRERPASRRDRFALTDDPPYIQWPGGGGYQPCAISINGTDLIELVRRVERPFVDREIAERVAAGEDRDAIGDYAGDYLGMNASRLRLPRRELLDQPFDTAASGFVLTPNDPRRGKTTVLGCTCGITECWFLLVRVTVLDDAVVWSDFEQFHRPWIYDLGPYVFDKPQYLEQLTPA